MKSKPIIAALAYMASENLIPTALSTKSVNKTDMKSRKAKERKKRLKKHKKLMKRRTRK